MNKHAAEKIASEYYNLGVQLALQESGLMKTAGPSPMNKIRLDAFQEASGGLSHVPYQHYDTVTPKDMAAKYDTSLEDIMARARKGKDAANSARDMMSGLEGGGRSRVPYRN